MFCEQLIDDLQGCGDWDGSEESQYIKRYQLFIFSKVYWPQVMTESFTAFDKWGGDTCVLLKDSGEVFS